MPFTYQMSQTRLNLQVTLMMEEERKENQSEEPDALTLQENSQETSHNGSALPVSVKEKVKVLHTLKFKLIFHICVMLSANNVGLFSTGSGIQKCSHAVLHLPVTQGSLCCTTSDAAPTHQLRPPAEQKSTEPATTADRSERPEGPV